MKLCRSEWQAVEVPISINEQIILSFIQTAAVKNVEYKLNRNLSLLGFLNLASNHTKSIDEFIFEKYLKKRVEVVKSKMSIVEKSLANNNNNNNVKTKLNSADTIRLTNSIKQDGFFKTFEFILMDQLEKFMSAFPNNQKTCILHLYTIQELLKKNIPKLNSIFVSFCHMFLVYYESQCNKIGFIEFAVDIFEKNSLLLEYDDLTLYDHQKELFTICNLKHARPTAKLILYNAPTGTGKTMAPIGLISCGHRILFVCAARHVGLALARAAISVHQKVGFAFGCKSISDIRLHYFASIHYDPFVSVPPPNTTKKNVSSSFSSTTRYQNHENGRNVEIMICDLASFTFAHEYMCSFFDSQSLILFWDDVTIALDEEDNHPIHGSMKTIWRTNRIETVILVSATLPFENDIQLVIDDFRSRFHTRETAVHSILAHDCKKTIALINKTGHCILPHNSSSDGDLVSRICQHCQTDLTLLRYLDLQEVARFLVWMQSNPTFQVCQVLFQEKFPVFFPRMADIHMKQIKLFYLQQVQALAAFEEWPQIFQTYKLFYDHARIVSSSHSGGIFVTTEDAYTLTDGPTLFLCENIDTIVKFCLQQANVPKEEMVVIYEAIETNKLLHEKIQKKEEEQQFLIEQNENSGGGGGANKGMTKKKTQRDLLSDNTDSTLSRIRNDLDNLRTLFVSAQLRNIFIPNKREHLEHWAAEKNHADAFTSNISEPVVQEILGLTGIPDSWKMLLLMGIGVYSVVSEEKEQTDISFVAYTEMIKKLADEQKLFLTIASMDFIWGLNNQYCHGYIGKKTVFSQEKMRQAIGRIGRGNIQQTYSIRFRDDTLDILQNVFLPNSNKREAIRMQLLFHSLHITYNKETKQFFFQEENTETIV